MSSPEKEWLNLQNSGHDSANIVIANASDDGNLGHIAISTWDKESHNFAHVFLTKIELSAIIAAFNAVLCEMTDD